MKLVSRFRERAQPSAYTSWQDISIDLGRYVFAKQHVKDKRVLDIACGTGYGSNFLHGRGAASVVGVDLSAEATRYASGRYKKLGLEFLVADAQEMPFRSSSFDAVVTMETIEHLHNHKRFLQECHRVLSPGGTFVCSTPNGELSSPNPYHLKEFPPNELRQLLATHFDQVVLLGYVQFRSESTQRKLTRRLASSLYSSPAFVQTLVLRVMSILTHFVLTGYRPVRLQDVDHTDFESVMLEIHAPFHLDEGIPKYLIAVGQKPRTP